MNCARNIPGPLMVFKVILFGFGFECTCHSGAQSYMEFKTRNSKLKARG